MRIFENYMELRKRIRDYTQIITRKDLTDEEEWKWIEGELLKRNDC